MDALRRGERVGAARTDERYASQGVLAIAVGDGVAREGVVGRHVETSRPLCVAI